MHFKTFLKLTTILFLFSTCSTKDTEIILKKRVPPPPPMPSSYSTVYVSYPSPYYQRSMKIAYKVINNTVSPYWHYYKFTDSSSIKFLSNFKLAQNQNYYPKKGFDVSGWGTPIVCMEFYDKYKNAKYELFNEIDHYMQVPNALIDNKYKQLKINQYFRFHIENSNYISGQIDMDLALEF